jgi:hypothetical protein
MTETEATLVGALVGGAIGVIGTYFGALRIERIKIRYVVNNKLREAFAIELATLQRADEKFNHISLLDSSFLKHQIAVNEFTDFLDRFELFAFNKAWHKYYNYPKQIKNPLDGPFFETKYPNTPYGRSEAIKNIEAILAFSNPSKWFLYPIIK